MKRQVSVPKDLFTNPDFFHYIVQYRGDIIGDVTRYPNYYVTKINDTHAIVSVKGEVELNVEKPIFITIIYVMPLQAFTLQEISPIQASQANFLQLNLPLNLTGRGVNVAIIDTGVDYLSEEFMNLNGETRIEAIWDQTIETSEKDNSLVPFGAVYFKEEIQKAIQVSKDGGVPYDLVPSNDEIGHGTNMAGIIGGTGKNPELRGIIPECNFVIVKLVESISNKVKFNIKIPVFEVFSIFTALEFLYRYSIINYKPMVIFLPLGSNLGNHKGNGYLEKYIELLSLKSSIAIVTGTGNEGATGTHTSGMITEVGGVSVMELDVSSEQRNLIVEIWIDSPNIMSLDIVSPSGENSGIISARINAYESYAFIFEKTSTKINYFLPEEISGDELIRIRFYNIQSGIWKLRLTGNNILNGKYNAWIPQNGISIGGTSFSFADPYGTMTNPGSSNYIITAASYNQNNNNILSYSGMDFLDSNESKIDVVAGGVNAVTVAPNNKVAVVNGTSVSAAVVAGVCAMLFQWGIIEGNNPYIYSQAIKVYLARGTDKRSGDIYPNAQWGYGILDVLTMFDNMI